MEHVTDAFWLIEMLKDFGLVEGEWVEPVEPENGFNAEDYLHKGERILNLLREREKREGKMKDAINPVFEVLTAKSMEKSGDIMVVLRRIATKIVNPVLNEICSKWEEEHSIEALVELIKDVPVTIKECESYSPNAKVVSAVTKKSTNIAVEITYGEQLKAYASLNYPIQKSRQHKELYLRAYGKDSATFVVDLAFEAAKFVMLSQVVRHMVSLGKDAAEDVVKNRLIWEFENRIERCYETQREKAVRIRQEDVTNVALAEWANEKEVILLPTSCGTRVRYDDIMFLELAYGMVDNPAFLTELSGWYLPSCIEIAFRTMYEEYQKSQRSREFFRNMSKEHAHVYETKKGIPYKVVKEMKESGFNDFFGYVEFDEECDLLKVREIELEFRALQTIFRQTKHGEVSLRFRRLGNYKALGLYFPILKCLCVDVRSPSSMTHEYFHMLDYEYGKMSRKASFQEVYELCKKFMEEYVDVLPADSNIRKAWYGKSKYNRDYYLEPTEVFARCGEIYVTRILGISNSLCKPELGFAYPNNEVLNEKIGQYYDTFLRDVASPTFLENEKKKAAV